MRDSLPSCVTSRLQSITCAISTPRAQSSSTECLHGRVRESERFCFVFFFFCLKIRSKRARALVSEHNMREHCVSVWISGYSQGVVSLKLCHCITEEKTKPPRLNKSAERRPARGCSFWGFIFFGFNRLLSHISHLCRVCRNKVVSADV